MARLFGGLSYEEVVAKYTSTVGKVCVMRLQNWADAEDCYQNVFVKLWSRSPGFNDEEHLKAWLIRVAINECASYVKKNRRSLPLENASEVTVHFDEDSRDMSWALMKLEPKYRDVLYLHYAEDYKVSEIAEILGAKENTVKTLLRRGREKLKRIYGGD